MNGSSLPTICIGADHPALPGHFPGNPLVPGVVLLAKVLALLQPNAQAGARVRALSRVKFLAHVRPGEAVGVRFSPSRPGAVRFECWRDDTLIAAGYLELEVPRAGGATDVG